MTALDPHTADRLAKVAALFGSDKLGERAAAAAKADEIVRSHGLTWQQILRREIAPDPARSLKEQIDFCLDHGADVLTCWEWRFVNGIRDWSASLTEKQRRKLEQLVAKVRAARYAA